MLRFVPIPSSLTDTAPGYNASPAATEGDEGPICWKCDGKGSVKLKEAAKHCTVCDGKKRLRVKSSVAKAKNNVGIITKRSVPDGWLPREPYCAHGSTETADLPVELHPQNGEELCVLVGDWRIYQRTGGHRWTTDDLVTGWVAGRLSRTQENSLSSGSAKIHRTLDLGCGNGSVLMMVAWQYPHARCIGVEARAEAVALARRSIKYNCGDGLGGTCRVTVVNEDFRRLIHPSNNLASAHSSSVPVETGHSSSVEGILGGNEKFDLITGTPPYFRVDFQLSKAADASGVHELDTTTTSIPTVEKALIRQGGMPTCKESAPARCEFRGGIEAYCAAAACNLAPEGSFVVCENWANHDRVLVAAVEAGLHIISMQRVVGKEGKPPLFCVYTMTTNATAGSTPEHGYAANHAAGQSASAQPATQQTALEATHGVFEVDLVVRDKQGAWTERYAELLRDMNYPVVSLHPNGSY